MKEETCTFSGYEDIGPYRLHKFELKAENDTVESHRHYYDHLTWIVSGKVRVTGGKTPSEHKEGEYIFIPASQIHGIVAIDGPAKVICQFLHRDKDGNPSPVPDCPLAYATRSDDSWQ